MNKLNKKGFTLVELLAVIVILGVIMLIAIPSIGTIIQNSRLNSFASSGKMYISTAQNYVAGEVTMSDGDYYMSVYELNNKKLDASPINPEKFITGYVKVTIENGNGTYSAYICEADSNSANATCRAGGYHANGLTSQDDRKKVGTEGTLTAVPAGASWKTDIKFGA